MIRKIIQAALEHIKPSIPEGYTLTIDDQGIISLKDNVNIRELRDPEEIAYRLCHADDIQIMNEGYVAQCKKTLTDEGVEYYEVTFLDAPWKFGGKTDEQAREQAQNGLSAMLETQAWQRNTLPLPKAACPVGDVSYFIVTVTIEIPGEKWYEL